MMKLLRSAEMKNGVTTTKAPILKKKCIFITKLQNFPNDDYGNMPEMILFKTSTSYVYE